MNKLVFCILLLSCYSCGLQKKQEVLQSIAHTSPGDQVYILTIFPGSYTDTSNAVLSLLVLSSNNQNKHGLLAYSTQLKPDKTNAPILSFYADSIEDLNQTRFPILFETELNDSSGNVVQWSIEKQKFLFRGKTPENEVSWELKHNEKNSYARWSDINDTVITAFKPIATRFTDNIAGIENREYMAFLNIVKNAGFLFDRSRSSYYWFDSRTENGQYYSLFVAMDDSHEIHVLYNTFPYEGTPVLTENEIYWETAAKTRQASILFPKETNKLRFFRAENTQLIKDELRIGKGVMYQL